MATGGEEEAGETSDTFDGSSGGYENYTKFLILGGGISGLSAASTFSKHNNNDYKLLEARNRLGGRIATMQIGQLDMGLTSYLPIGRCCSNITHP